MGRIDRVKIVLRAAKLATDIDIATLSQNAVDLVNPQPAQHVANAFA